MTSLMLTALLFSAPGTPLGGVVNAERARALPRGARAQLAGQGFTVVEGAERHFFSLYDRNAYEKVPSFISVDVVLHLFHVRFDADLAALERDTAAPALRSFASGQLARALARWPEHRLPALYHATALKLLDPEAPLDARVDDTAGRAAEALARGASASVVHPSCPLPLDATRFKPRGHYDGTGRLQAYFRGFTFYASCAFPLEGDGEARARAIVALLDEPARQALARVTRLVEFVGGKSDSVTALDVAAGHGAPRPAGRSPTFRLLGVADTSQARLLERTAPARIAAGLAPFPSALDVFAALGSREAHALLAPPPGLAEVLREPFLLDGSLAGRWLGVLQTLVSRPATPVPPFATSDAWARRTLVAAAGSWAELSHDTLLYVRQPDIMLEGGHDAELPAAKVGGYVDPRPDVYRALLALREALDDAAAEQRADGGAPAPAGPLAEFLRFVIDTSELELANAPFPRAVDERLRTVGSELEHLSRTRGDDSPRQALIADVFTLSDPDKAPRVLHVATGDVDELWVIVPRAGRRVLMRGGAFSYYELVGPRLSDIDWSERLFKDRPARPAWAAPVPRVRRLRPSD